MRAIIYLLFIVLVFLILRFTLNRVIEIREKQKAQRAASAKQNSTDEDNEKDQTQEMVRCAQCGVHLPQSEAYYDGKDTFCSEGHMNEFHEKNRQ